MTMIKLTAIMKKNIVILSLAAIVTLISFGSAFAQFEEPELRKVTKAERASFESRFADISWSGQGLYNPTTIDRIPTIELRSRLQAVFGDPTQTIGDLINNNFRPGKAIQFEYRTVQIEDHQWHLPINDKPIFNNNFRPGKAIQFEYWFIIDGEMPLMLLDLDGPFENGLVYVGASRYIDRMPQVKRTLSRLLMSEEGEPAEFSDYFYSPQREQWYRVEYTDGEVKREMISRPTTFN